MVRALLLSSGMKTIERSDLMHVIGGRGGAINLPAPRPISKLPAQLPGPAQQLPPLIMPPGGWVYKAAGWWEWARKSGNIR